MRVSMVLRARSTSAASGGDARNFVELLVERLLQLLRRVSGPRGRLDLEHASRASANTAAR